MNNYEKYADLLLKKCLNIRKNEPLLVNAPITEIEFVRLLAKKAYELGVNDIYFDFDDDVLKYDQLKNLDVDALKNSRFWNKEIWDEYAKKGAAFLMLYGPDPDLMSDIDANVVKEVSTRSRTSRPLYKQKQSINEIAWCIAGIPTEAWAKKIFGDVPNAKRLLWDKIFDICLINEDDPLDAWDKLNKINSERCKKLNDLHFKELHYTNSLGTDLTVELREDAIFCGGAEKGLDGRELIMNMPTIEVFTTPILDKTNGVVYSAKPLVYSGSLIENFNITFKDGKAISCSAEKGLDILKGIIETDANSCYLGEVALVDYNSPISNTNLIFYETLFDENASCHLALGAGFPTCFSTDYTKKSKEELLKLGINESDNHVDFMVGTKDLKITGTTYNGEEYVIFEDGNFVLE